VKPSKIVAGQEAEKTNELLQAMALALEKKVIIGPRTRPKSELSIFFF
jgi:hypothetical protein